ncbi:MAG TPA: glycosyltransferase, partial [Reyranellaceae bacterium]|nr:glycosyltransferase [Reyranellaceae bacterium]
MSGLRRESVSAVVVFEDRPPDLLAVKDLAEQLARRFMDSEIILVANGVDDTAAVALKALTEEVPDLSVLFLATRLDGDEATLAGIENAVGDWVLLVEAGASTIAALPQLFDRLDQGFDVVIGRTPERRGPGPRRFAIEAYFALYRMLNGVD